MPVRRAVKTPNASPCAAMGVAPCLNWAPLHPFDPMDCAEAGNFGGPLLATPTVVPIRAMERALASDVHSRRSRSIDEALATDSDDA